MKGYKWFKKFVVGIQDSIDTIIILFLFIIFYFVIKSKFFIFLFTIVVLCIWFNRINKFANEVNYSLYNYIKLKLKIYFLLYYQIYLIIFSIIINIFVINFITGSLFDYEFLIAYASNDDNKIVKKIDDIIINTGRNTNNVINQDQIQNNVNNNINLIYISNVVDDSSKEIDFYISILDWSIEEISSDDDHTTKIKNLQQRLIDQNFYINELYDKISNNLLLNKLFNDNNNVFNNNTDFDYTVEGWNRHKQNINRNFLTLMRDSDQTLLKWTEIDEMEMIESMEIFLIKCDIDIIYALDYYLKQDYITQQRSFYDFIIEMNFIKKYLFILNKNYLYYNENFDQNVSELDSKLDYYNLKLVKFNLKFNEFYIRLNDAYVKFLISQKYEN